MNKNEASSIHSNEIGDLKVCRLEHDDVEDILKLMEDVVSRLPSRTLFATDDIDYLHAHIEEHGEIYGAFSGGRLAAYSVLAFPGSAAKNLGREFGVPEDELHLVAIFDATIVHESVRGRGLQRYFHHLREQRARARGFLYVYSTVHPDNEASRRNLEAAGFSLQFTRPMYGGHPRHCYAKRL
ncbi:GNAT family N-acetyltransferase [Paenibacillus sp. UNC451MF]|uniref:GNAT family N-acetyltransferase n=1 Tax=Paenibacillus sp. UNC451MF TaxID=1449063 RepID=UPI0006902CAB|nr:GNAT family N-acetyltransferase [Paenibacillus sp. UNC451MF]